MSSATSWYAPGASSSVDSPTASTASAMICSERLVTS